MRRTRFIEDLLAQGDYKLIDAAPGNPWPLHRAAP